MLVRVFIAVACILLGFAFFPMFLVGALIAWSIVQDIREAPERRLLEAESDERARAPVSANYLRDACESPAEVAFLNAMIDEYGLKTGEGALEGGGLRLTNQRGLGKFRIFSHHTSYQYRADFLIDENLVIEIDGAAYHSSPEAIARDRKRDADIAREGYQTLRIPARDVFQTPSKAIAAVEDARQALGKGGNIMTDNSAAVSSSRHHSEAHIPLLSRLSEAVSELDARSRQFHASTVIEGAISAMLGRIEVIVERASEMAILEMPPESSSESERRGANEIALRKIVETFDAESNTTIDRNGACSKAVDAISRCAAQDSCERVIERSVDAHMKKLEEAYGNLFPEKKFPEWNLSELGYRETLIEQLRAIFFEGANPNNFFHPYVPPAKDKFFGIWWRAHVAGDLPFSLALKCAAAGLKSNTKQ